SHAGRTPKKQIVVARPVSELRAVQAEPRFQPRRLPRRPCSSATGTPRDTQYQERRMRLRFRRSAACRVDRHSPGDAKGLGDEQIRTRSTWQECSLGLLAGQGLKALHRLLFRLWSAVDTRDELF